MFSSFSRFFFGVKATPIENVDDDFLLVDRDDLDFDSKSEDGEWIVVGKVHQTGEEPSAATSICAPPNAGSFGSTLINHSSLALNSDIPLAGKLEDTSGKIIELITTSKGSIISRSPKNRLAAELGMYQSGDGKKSSNLAQRGPAGALIYGRRHVTKMNEWNPIKCNKKSLKRNYKAMMYSSGQKKH